MVIADADGDTKPDLVVSNYGENAIVVMRNNISGKLPPPSIIIFNPAKAATGATVTI